MKRFHICPGCKTKVGPRSDAAIVTTTDDNGVQATTAICLPCMIRIVRDKDFAARFDAAAVAAVTGSIQA